VLVFGNWCLLFDQDGQFEVPGLINPNATEQQRANSVAFKKTEINYCGDPLR
jgi:hypothetical protein